MRQGVGPISISTCFSVLWLLEQNAIGWVHALNDRHLFPPMLEVEKAKIKVTADSVSGEDTLPNL